MREKFRLWASGRIEAQPQAFMRIGGHIQKQTKAKASICINLYPFVSVCIRLHSNPYKPIQTHTNQYICIERKFSRNNESFLVIERKFSRNRTKVFS